MQLHHYISNSAFSVDVFPHKKEKKISSFCCPNTTDTLHDLGVLPFTRARTLPLLVVAAKSLVSYSRLFHAAM